MSGYVSNVPLSNQTLGQTQPTINTNFTVLNDNMGVDHVDFTNAAFPIGLGGTHEQVTLSSYGSVPYSNTGVISYAYSRGVNNSSSLRSCVEYQASQSASNLLPMTPKAMVRIDKTGAILSGYQFNIASVMLAGSNFTITFSEALANTNYYVLNGIEISSPATPIAVVGSKNAGSFILACTNLSSVAAISVVIY